MLLLLLAGIPPLHAQDQDQAEAPANEEELPELEMFIAEESAALLADTVLPTDSEISGLFGDTTSVLEVPRAVTLSVTLRKSQKVG